MSNENMEVDNSSDSEEVVEETLIHVVMDNPEETVNVNPNSNVRLIGIDSESPALQIENKVYHINEWRYIPGTAMFFEQKHGTKTIDPLYDNRSAINLQYIGSTRKCLEMTKKETNT